MAPALLITLKSNWNHKNIILTLFQYENYIKTLKYVIFTHGHVPVTVSDPNQGSIHHKNLYNFTRGIIDKKTEILLFYRSWKNHLRLGRYHSGNLDLNLTNIKSIKTRYFQFQIQGKIANHIKNSKILAVNIDKKEIFLFIDHWIGSSVREIRSTQVDLGF